MTTPAEFSALTARIQRLEDIEAIRSLRNRYHQAINDGRFSEIVDLFTHTAVVELGYLARYEGRAAIEAFMAARFADVLRGPPKVLAAPGHSFSDVAKKVLHLVTVEEVD